MFNFTYCLNRKLTIVAICPLDNAHSLELFEREGCYRLLFVAYQSQTPDATAIGECNVLATWLKLPPRRFVFNGTIVVLKAGIAFFARLVVLVVLIEAGDSGPGSISTGLSGLGVKTGGKRVLLG